MLENKILKEALELARPKKPARSRALVGRGRFPMNSVADTLGVARSNLVEAARGQRRPRKPYRKAGDAKLQAASRSPTSKERWR